MYMKPRRKLLGKLDRAPSRDKYSTFEMDQGLDCIIKYMPIKLNRTMAPIRDLKSWKEH